ncbi:hypothetical protein FRACYDRAFT_238443 [Fragilariopsis cylindrus CCMP1102]|uniref:DUF6824 domain-containing protein n=1 Tax=Fragilariopsis cylindrus CCMP1102 TaxID=635003 RepID=A0A1E7FIL4_9STRA|nr:hypothetical protein FRACYDRAFT_238443 [Fragilariopsis cylindrus CCMP1102]|eukprot:OEU18012.1 hypothetical protein FRACYDRAFT_238443 [Fragilariopsis cylindrus CCMP1102]
MMSYTNNKPTPLPSTFTPSKFDVICAPGKTAKIHSGNIFYRTLIQDAVECYSKATSKYEKTSIVTQIADAVQARSSEGGFIKKDKSNGFYYVVGDDFAREKIGQNLRDSLSTLYKSSTRAKRTRRMAINAKLTTDIDNLIQTNLFVEDRRQILNSNIERSDGQSKPDFFMNELFIKTNIEILEAFKNDQALLIKFNQVEKNNKILSKQ